MACHESHPETFDTLIQKAENTGFTDDTVSFEWAVAGIFDSSHLRKEGRMDGLEECREFQAPFMILEDRNNRLAWGVAAGTPFEDSYPVQVAMDKARKHVVGILLRFIDPPCDDALALGPLKTLADFQVFMAKGGRTIEDFLEHGDRLDPKLVDYCREWLHSVVGDPQSEVGGVRIEIDSENFISMPIEEEMSSAALYREWSGWVYSKESGIEDE